MRKTLVRLLRRAGYSAAMLAAVVMCAFPASADIVYTTYGNGGASLGVIDTADADEPEVQRDVLTGLGSDVFLSSFRESRSQRVVVIDRVMSGNDRVSVYDTRQDWNMAIFSGDLVGSQNTHGFTASQNDYDNSIFTASYNNASINEYPTKGYGHGHSYTYKAPDGWTGHAERVLVNNRLIFALFSAERTDGNGKMEYLPSKLVLFDGQLTDGNSYSSFDVGKNVSGIAPVNGDIVAVSCFGGMQGYGARGGISGYYRRSNTIFDIVSDDNNLGGIASICAVGDDTLVFIEQKYADPSSQRPDLALWSWKGNKDSGKLTRLRDIPFAGGGYMVDLAWDSGAKLLAVMAGDRIILCRSDGTTVREFTSDQLGGDPYAVTSTIGASSGNSSENSGGGCNEAGLGAISLIVLASLFRRSR